ncbi:hypothetical protein QF004_001910 [Chryseobacterium sp. MDT2-18]|nr:hypothetical protein [Chryseobacterium sp. MDT2-18]
MNYFYPITKKVGLKPDFDIYFKIYFSEIVFKAFKPSPYDLSI